MKKTLCLFSLVFYVLNLNAQHFETGASIGISNYLGDLAPSSLWLSLGESHMSTSFFVKYNFNSRFAIKGGVNYGRIGADDASSHNSTFRKGRNLSFRSDIFEGAITGEFNLLRYQPYLKESIFAPYFFAGIAVYNFNPKTQFENEWHELQPLGTEGQGMPGNSKKYSKTQFSIPAGVGLKFALDSRINIGVEIGWRKTFTDYLDDVSGFYPDLGLLSESNSSLAAELSWRSDEVNPNAILPAPGTPRGDPTDLDGYIFSTFSVSYNFFNYSNSNKKRTPTKLKCFHFY